MSEFRYTDIEYLNVPLPEDILKKKWFGDFEGALRLIELRLQLEIPLALRKKLELEKRVLEILPKEYTIPYGEAFSMVKERIPDFTTEEFDKLQEESKIDWIYVKGEVRYFRRFLSTLLKVNDDLAVRVTNPEDWSSSEARINQLEEEALSSVLKRIKEKKQVTYHFRIRASVKINDDAFQKGRVRVHMPFPVNCKQGKGAKVIKSDSEITFLADANASQRTAYFEENLSENKAFIMEYEYDNSIDYVEPNLELVGNTKQTKIEDFAGNWKVCNDEVTLEDLSEQIPHIRFTPYMKSLANEIIGDEENPYKKARKVYDYITTKIHYSFMREYVTIENITEYAALGGKGDCGVQSLVFITLCRIAGIPARWQSGLYTTPYTAGSHDWSQFYVAPYGWLFADCSFGGTAYRKGNMEQWNFYFGNLDPFRMAANASFQKEFTPQKKFLRADPYDNQRGEIEYETRGLSYHEFQVVREILECYEIEQS